MIEPEFVWDSAWERALLQATSAAELAQIDISHCAPSTQAAEEQRSSVDTARSFGSCFAGGCVSGHQVELRWCS